MTDNKKKTRGLTRRQTLGALAGAAGTAVLAASCRPSPPPHRPSARRSKLTYWNWADNPSHQKISVDSVAISTQGRLHRDRGRRLAVTMEARKKLVVSFAAGAAPDIS